MRQYKMNELFPSYEKGMLLGDSQSLLLHYVMKPITDTDGQEVEQSLYDFTQEYLQGFGDPATVYNYTILDDNFVTRYGDMLTVREYASKDAAIADIQDRSAACLMSHVNDLTRLYYALSLSYNPLYNKDATETDTQTGSITDTHSGTDDTEIKGKTQDSVASTDTGSRSGTSLSSVTVTEDVSKVPINNNNFYDKDRTETETPVMATDSTATNNVDYHNTTGYGHIITKGFNKTDSHRSYGNLGVTKSTDLLESEYMLRTKHAFWDYVYHLCMDPQIMRGVVLCE